jgi:uncharacterized SAM-binding protein YcdF (DUF218 family)
VLGAAGLVLLVVPGMFPVANALERSLEDAARPTFRDDVVYDAVVLLGGVVDEDAMARSGQISFNDNVERLVVTHRLLQEGKAQVTIVSGAAMARPELGEAVVLAQQLASWGIAKERIGVEPRARNTRENALYTQEIVRARGYQRVLVVTSAFHMARAKECFAAVGLDVDTLAVDYRAHDHAGRLAEWVPRAQAASITSTMLRELAGRYIYRAQGYGKASR